MFRNWLQSPRSWYLPKETRALGTRLNNHMRCNMAEIMLPSLACLSEEIVNKEAAVTQFAFLNVSLFVW